MLQKENNPWKGFNSYQYSDADLFFGREKDLDSLSQSIKDNYCTILYGVSGVGKTSLIDAGLCPRLEKEGFLPIRIKLDHDNKESESYSRQILTMCQEALSQKGYDYESPFDQKHLEVSDADRLWLFFHSSAFWSSKREKIIPCVFIDQFEEIFEKNSQELSKVSGFFEEFNEVYQSIPSEELLCRLNNEPYSLSLDDRPSFRIVFALREDFLARVEDYSQDYPFLRKNRRHLDNLNGKQAFDVITKPYPGLVDDETAMMIIAMVSGNEKKNLEQIDVYPPTLSLFCSDLYEKAVDNGYERITADLVQAQGDDIILDFYLDHIKGIPQKTIKYLESHLLTASGFRNQLAKEDIDESFLPDKEIKKLVQGRIIRWEYINGTSRLVFSHDVLARKIYDYRNSTRDQKKNLIKVLGVVLNWVMVILFGGLLAEFRYRFFVPYTGVEQITFLFFNDNVIIFNIVLILLALFGVFVFTGLLSLTSMRLKNKMLAALIAVIACSFFVVSFILYGRDPFPQLRWTGPVVMIIAILAASVFSFRKHVEKTDIKTAFRLSFHLEEIRNDSRRWCFVAGMFLFSLFIVYRATVIKSAILTLVSLYLLLASFVGTMFMLGEPLKTPRMKRWRVLGAIGFIVLSTVFLLSTYSPVRFLSYVSLAALFVTGIWYSKNSHKTSLRLGVRIAICSFFWIICPLCALGYSLFSQGNNVRSGVRPVECPIPSYKRGLWEPVSKYSLFVPIVDKEGRYGLISNRGIELKPQFDGLLDEYRMLSSENLPYPSWPSERFFVKGDSGEYEPWDVMFHLDEDNLLTRKYIKRFQQSPFGVISARIILSSLHPQKDAAQFNEYAERLFFNELGFSLVRQAGIFSNSYIADLLIDDISDVPTGRISLPRHPSLNKKEMELYRPEKLYDSLLSLVTRNDEKISRIPYEAFSESLEAISTTTALQSPTLCDKLEKLISAYISLDKEDWRMHNDLALILIQKGLFDKAENEAWQAVNLTSEKKPIVTLIETLLLQDKYEDSSVFLQEEASSIINKEHRRYYGFNSGIRRNQPLYSPPDFCQSYLGDIILADTVRYSYPEKCKSFIRERLSSYGGHYGYSKSYEESLVSFSPIEKGSTSDPGSPTILLCQESALKPEGRNWDDVTVRKGGISYGPFERITLSDYPAPSVYTSGGKRGYIHLADKDLTISPPLYDYAWIYSDGIAVVISNDELMFIDTNGRVIAKPDVKAFSDMDLVFEKGTLVYRDEDNLYGLLGKDGAWILPPEYDYIGKADSEGSRLVKQDGFYGLINNDGVLSVKPKFPEISADEEYIRVTLTDGKETLHIQRKPGTSMETALHELLGEGFQPAEYGRSVYYQVKAGDSIAKIAREHGMSVREFCQLNGITEYTTLRIGQYMKVKE